MKRVKFVFTGLFISGLLTACTEEETKIEQVKSQETIVETVNSGAVVNDAKVWSDVSTPEGFDKYGIEPTLKDWIAYHTEDISKTTNVNEYYPKANIIALELKYFRIQGEDLEKDFENLQVLQHMMGHLNYVISEEKKRGSDTGETYGEMKKTFKFFSELLHDLNIVINHNEKGETFGLTHQLDGNRVKELKKFIYGPADWYY